MLSQKLGNDSESAFTKTFHQSGMPVLLSSLVLRARGCGQVDCAKLEFKGQHKILKLQEVKTNQWVSRTQRARLNRSAEFLAKIFDCGVTVSFAFSQNEFAKKQKLH